MKRFVIISLTSILLLALIVGIAGRQRHHKPVSDVSAADKMYPAETEATITEEITEFTYDKRQVPDVTTEIIIARQAYTMSYNPQTLCPNWVAWHLTAEHTDGRFNRKEIYYDNSGEACGIGKVTSDMIHGTYIVDMEVPEPRATHDDWYPLETNISHGHICPAGDCKWSQEAMNQSNLLSNICPQNSRLNSGGWNRLEEKCRQWAVKYGDIYIVAGPLFYGEVIQTIGRNRIAVPDAFFKVILCLHDEPKAIGFIYANNAESHKIGNSVCKVDDVERISGFDFFSELDDEVEDVIEADANITMW